LLEGYTMDKSGYSEEKGFNDDDDFPEGESIQMNDSPMGKSLQK
jgi:hypothetical protein